MLIIQFIELSDSFPYLHVTVQQSAEQCQSSQTGRCTSCSLPHKYHPETSDEQTEQAV